MNKYDPYCPVCSGCGEEGCCSPMACKMSEEGRYCKTYLKHLKFAYLMYQELFEMLHESDPDRADAIFDKNYDKIYGK